MARPSSTPTYPVRETKDVRIPLIDGVTLAANLYLPEGVGPVPAIVVYFPYLKDSPSGQGSIGDWQAHFAARGYACLTVDVRGTGGSEGVAAPPNSLSEKRDAREMLDWIAAQPWCDGTTGMWGISYSGSTSIAAASTRPPSLRAIVPMHGTPDEYLGFLHPHGCRPAWWTENSWGPGQLARHLLPPLHRDPERRWARIWRERLETLEPWPYLWHTVPVDTYMSWRSDLSKIEAATYAVCSWHDYYPKATLDYYNAIDAPKRVLIGPWKHEFPDLAVNHPIDHLSEMDRWWDRWLTGVDNGVDREPPVMVWQQGEERWRFESAWPPTRGREVVFYAGPEGRLTRRRPSGEDADTYRVDPTVGLLLLPWDPQAPVVPMPYDRAADDHRALTYTTPPLDETLEIAGDPVATIALTADQSEFPLSVWLGDVHPSGLSTLICQGWVSASFAAGGPLRADRVYEIDVPLYSTSYQLPAGHRLRLGIAGADFPLLWPAPTSPTLRVRRSATHPTRLRLPIAPIGAAPQGGPAFGAPRIGPARSRLYGRPSSQIVRDLTGRTAAFHQRAEGADRLADGSIFRLRSENISTIEAARPDEASFTGRVEIEIERPTDAVGVVVDTIQTHDQYHFEGTIRVDGKPFFRRTWNLDL